MLSKATTTKQLWSMIKKFDNWVKKRHSSIDSYSASDFDTHFSSIATDVDYCKDKIISVLF